MPLYSLGNVTPTTAGHGTYWVAPDAHFIGDVRLGATWVSGFAPCCAETRSHLS